MRSSSAQSCGIPRRSRTLGASPCRGRRRRTPPPRCGGGRGARSRSSRPSAIDARAGVAPIVRCTCPTVRRPRRRRSPPTPTPPRSIAREGLCWPASPTRRTDTTSSTSRAETRRTPPPPKRRRRSTRHMRTPTRCRCHRPQPSASPSHPHTLTKIATDAGCPRGSRCKRPTGGAPSRAPANGPPHRHRSQCATSSAGWGGQRPPGPRSSRSRSWRRRLGAHLPRRRSAREPPARRSRASPRTPSALPRDSQKSRRPPRGCCR
mmetsp:Transcript_131085/g.379242  ORF Transcript_131085/g.379242 Transcript_131085/m.379242 type:complete len:263 (-) Transcript_131085:922-1710(-)